MDNIQNYDSYISIPVINLKKYGYRKFNLCTSWLQITERCNSNKKM
jgi:hypothetical protein